MPFQCNSKKNWQCQLRHCHLWLQTSWSIAEDSDHLHPAAFFIMVRSTLREFLSNIAPKVSSHIHLCFSDFYVAPSSKFGLSLGQMMWDNNFLSFNSYRVLLYLFDDSSHLQSSMFPSNNLHLQFEDNLKTYPTGKGSTCRSMCPF